MVIRPHKDVILAAGKSEMSSLQFWHFVTNMPQHLHVALLINDVIHGAHSCTAYDLYLKLASVNQPLAIKPFVENAFFSISRFVAFSENTAISSFTSFS